jgi:uncharacterized protein (TIRG00374 family)
MGRLISRAPRVAFALVLFAAVIFAVEQFVPGAGHRLAQARPGWVAVSVGLELLALASYVLLFHAVFARAPHRLATRRSAQISLGEIGAYAVLPTGVGGPVLRFWALRASGMPLRTALVRSISHAAIFNGPYLLAALVLGVGVSLRLLPGHAPVLTALAPIGVVLVACALALGAVALSRASFLREDGVWRTRVRGALSTVPDGIRDLARAIRRPSASLGALGWWVGDCAALWAAFHAVGGAAPLTVLILAYMLGQLGSAVVPLPGGIGGVEPVMLGILVASGVGTSLGAAAIVCYRAISLGAQGAAGAVAFTTLTADVRSSRQRESRIEREPQWE